MLDPDEVAEYEAWKMAKLHGAQDLSAHAFNTEMEANALSWEEGWKARDAGEPYDSCRFRKPGAPGAKPNATTTTSKTEEEEQEE